MALPTTSKKVFTTLHFQAGATLHQPKVHLLTGEELGNLNNLIGGELAYSGSPAHLKLYDGSNWQDIHRTGVALSTGSQFTVSVADGTAPFAITSKTKVNNLKVEALGSSTETLADGTHRISDSATEHGIPVYGAGGVLKVNDPLTGDDAANRRYVDLSIQGLDHKESVKCATIANITLSGLTGHGSSNANLDGQTIKAGDRVLVKNQTTTSQNGIYVASGSGWSRADDADVGSNLLLPVDGAFTGTNGQAVAGWTASGGATAVYDTNRLKITGGNATASLTTEIGKTYRLKLDFIQNSDHRGGAYIGTTSGAYDIFTSSAIESSQTGYTIYFKALTTTTYIRLHAWDGGSEIAFYDNVTCVQDHMNEGAFVFVENGATLGGTSWVLSDKAEGTPATGNAFSQFSKAGLIDVESNGATAAPLTKVGDTINFAYNTDRFALNSNALDVKDGGIQTDQLGADSVTPLKLDDDGDFTMGGLTIDSATPSIILDKTETGWGALRFYKAGGQVSYISLDASEEMIYYQPSGLGHQFYAGGAAALKVNYDGSIGIGADATSPSGTLHVSTARYGGNILTGDNADFSVLDEAAANSIKYGWEPYGSNTLAISNEQLVITNIDNNSTGYRYLTPTTIGRKYKAQIDAKYTGSGSAAVLQLWNGSSMVTVATLTTSLVTYTATFERVASAPYWKFGTSSGQSVTIDNLSLVEDTLASATGSDFVVADDLVINNGLTQAGMTLLGSGGTRIHFGESGHAAQSAIVNTYNDTKNSTLKFQACATGGTAADVLSLYGADQSAKFAANVGIGTEASTDSTVKLLLHSTNDTMLKMTRVHSGNTVPLVLLGDTGSTAYANLLLYSGTSSTYPVKISAGSVSYFNGGSVAIGSTSAACKLEVNTTPDYDAIAVRTSTAGTVGQTTGVRFQYSSAVPAAIRARLTNASSGAGDLGFYTAADGTSGNLTNRLEISSTGVQDHKANSIVNSATVAGLQDDACYDFDGTADYINVGATAELGTKVTLAVWANFDVVTAASGRDGIINSAYWTDNDISLHLDTNGRIRFTAGASKYTDWTVDSGQITVGAWTHLALVYDTSVATNNLRAKLYINGVLQTHHAQGGTYDVPLKTTSGLTIGKDANYFNGKMRDVKILVDALDAADIRKLYSGENPKKNLNVELVTNGTFDSDYSGWSAGAQSGSAPSLSISSSRLLVVNNATGNVPYAVYAATTVSGRMYKFQADVIYSNATIDVAVDSGTAGGTNLIDGSNVGSSGAEGTQTYFFTATSTTTYLSLRVLTTSAGANGLFDNISLQEVGTLVDFNPQSASSSKWRNEAIPALYHGTVNNATLSQGNSYWNNIRQDGETVSIGNPVNPSAKLHINEDSTATPLQITRASNSGNGMIKFETGTTGDWIVGLRNSPANSDFRFYSYGAAADALTITRSSGDVKIASKLGVGTSATFTDSQVAVVGDDNVGIALQSTHSGKTSRIRFFDNDGNQDATVGFANDTSNLFMGTGTNTHFVIDQSGNVSIGADSPSSKLDVYTDGDNKWNSSFLRDVAVDAWTGVHIGYGWHENNIYRKSGIAFKRTVASNALGELHIINDGTADSANGLSASRQASVQYWDYDGTQNHQGNRIVNSQTLNDSWRSSEPSLRFDGVDDVVNVGTGVLAHENITISLWVRPADKDSPSLQGLVTNNSTGNDRRDLCINNNRFEFAQTTSNSSHLITSTTAQCRENVWQHVVVTSATNGSDTDVVMYVDGVSVATKTISGDVMTDIADACKIGYLNSNRYFNGEIKEVRIHNRALEADDVKGLYNGEATSYADTDSNNTAKLEDDRGKFQIAESTSDSDKATKWIESASGMWEVNEGGASGGNATFTNPGSEGADKIYTEVFGASDVGKRFALTFTVSGTALIYIGVSTQGGHDYLGGAGYASYAAGTHTVYITAISGQTTIAFWSGNTSPTYNLSDVSLVRAGEIAAYTPQSIDTQHSSSANHKWLDITSNANHGSVTGAVSVGDNDHRGLMRVYGNSIMAPTYAVPNYNGSIQLGNNSNWCGRLEYNAGGVTDLRLDNSYNSTNAKTTFGMKTAGTRLPVLELLGAGSVKATSYTNASRYDHTPRQVARVIHYVIEPVANNTSTAFVMNHALNSVHIIVQVSEEGLGGAVVETDIRRGKWYSVEGTGAAGTGVTHGAFHDYEDNTDHNFVSVIFATAPASTSKYRVTIIS